MWSCGTLKSQTLRNIKYGVGDMATRLRKFPREDITTLAEEITLHHRWYDSQEKLVRETA
jgi:hypothetical protein